MSDSVNISETNNQVHITQTEEQIDVALTKRDHQHLLW